MRHAFNPVLIPLTVGLAAEVLVPNRAYTRSPITSTGATDDVFANLLAERKPAQPDDRAAAGKAFLYRRRTGRRCYRCVS